MYSKILNLEEERTADGKIAWDKLIGARSVYRLLYCLQIIESFMEEVPQAPESEKKPEESKVTEEKEKDETKADEGETKEESKAEEKPEEQPEEKAEEKKPEMELKLKKEEEEEEKEKKEMELKKEEWKRKFIEEGGFHYFLSVHPSFTK
jgi:hypothetical protein